MSIPIDIYIQHESGSRAVTWRSRGYMPVEGQDVSNLETPWQYGKALNACKRSHSWQQALFILVEAEGKGLANAVLFCTTLGTCDGAKWRISSEVLRRFGKSRIRGAGERDWCNPRFGFPSWAGTHVNKSDTWPWMAMVLHHFQEVTCITKLFTLGLGLRRHFRVRKCFRGRWNLALEQEM